MNVYAIVGEYEELKVLKQIIGNDSVVTWMQVMSLLGESLDLLGYSDSLQKKYKDPNHFIKVVNPYHGFVDGLVVGLQPDDGKVPIGATEFLLKFNEHGWNLVSIIVIGEAKLGMANHSRILPNFNEFYIERVEFAESLNESADRIKEAFGWM
ncbi:MAG: hypothetical protein QM520_05225 [Gammaproteobacteria bacterium]|nr:hypothetical protein [Gammaproteobacteria bacterium]